MAQAHADHHDANVYFVPHGSKWPVLASVFLFTMMAGVAFWLNGVSGGKIAFFVGMAGLLGILFKWFADVILESLAGHYNSQVDTSFRMGMVWFIFSEVMFFAAFFGALFYTRQFALPWLGGEGDGAMTNAMLWPEFSSAWPSRRSRQRSSASSLAPAPWAWATTASASTTRSRASCSGAT